MNHQSIVRIALELLVIREHSKRHNDANKVARLTYNVASAGQINPLLVRPSCETGQYEIIAGVMRYLALQQAKAVDAACIVVDRSLSEAQFLELVISENLQRFDPDVMEFSERLVRYMDTSGLNGTETAKRLGMSVAEVSRCRERVCEWPNELQLLVEQGLAPSTGHSIHKIADPDKKCEAMQLAAEGKLTRDTASSWAQESKNGRPQAARKNAAARIKASLAEGTVIITGTSLHPIVVVEMLTTLLRQARRAVSQGVTDASSLFAPPMPAEVRKSGALAKNRAPVNCQE